MISKSIINACMTTGKSENKDMIIYELLNHIGQYYDYNDNKVSHILEMLVDKKAIITVDKVNIEYVINNPKLLEYDYDKMNIKNVSISNIDNIEGTVTFDFDYKYKSDEDDKNINYKHTSSNISYIENPEILK